MWRFKIFTKKNSVWQVLRKKAFKLASNPKYDGYQYWLESMVCIFFDRKNGNIGIHTVTGIISEEPTIS